ncbi:Glutathione S-transferase zeta 2, partial [Operophtera brumata]
MKRIPFEEKGVDIVKGMRQRTEEYRAINPSQKVPALVIGRVYPMSRKAKVISPGKRNNKPLARNVPGPEYDY